MNKQFFSYLPIALLIVILFSVGCNKGIRDSNQPPETRLFVSAINLTREDRLTSEVHLFWSGEDQDGFVTGFEFSFDETSWNFVTIQDSIFSFSLTPGDDSTDINFWIRAVDDLADVDPTPAFLVVPIRNSPPVAKFDSTWVTRDTEFVGFSLRFNFSDPDGDESMDTAFIKINSGDWYSVDPAENFYMIFPDDPSATGDVAAKVYESINPDLLSDPINGLKLNDTNVVYVKVRDNTGTFSEIDTTISFFVKRKTSDLLILDSHSSGSSPTPEEVYFPVMSSLSLDFDYIDLQGNGNMYFPNIIVTDPTLLDPVFQFMVDLYDEVFWYTDASKVGEKLHLEACANLIQEYMNQEGKILISTVLPTDFDSLSPVYGFSPMDRISTSTGQARVVTNALIAPYGSFSTSYDTLESGSFITGADPFYPKDSSNIMFQAEITPVSGWIGPDIICARTTNLTRTNQVFCTLELHRLNERPAALETFFNQVFTNEFNW